MLDPISLEQLTKIRQGAEAVHKIPIEIGSGEPIEKPVRILTSREESLLPIFTEQHIEKAYPYKLDKDGEIYARIYAQETYRILAVMASTPYPADERWTTLDEYDARAKLTLELSEQFYYKQLVALAHTYNEIIDKYNFDIDSTSDERISEVYDLLKKRTLHPRDITYGQSVRIIDFLLDEIEAMDSLVTTQ